MSKSRPPTTKQALQPRSLSSMGFFPPRHTCQTFRGEHVSKSRGRPLVQLLARHRMPTTSGTAMALTADAWPSSCQHMGCRRLPSSQPNTDPCTLGSSLPVAALSPQTSRRKVLTAAPLLQCAKLCCHVGCPQSCACMRGSMAWEEPGPRVRDLGPGPGLSTAPSTTQYLHLLKGDKTITAFLLGLS